MSHMTLLPCHRCARLVLRTQLSCAACGAASERTPSARPATLAMMGIALAGCPQGSESDPIIQPAYGVPEQELQPMPGPTPEPEAAPDEEMTPVQLGPDVPERAPSAPSLIEPEPEP